MLKVGESSVQTTASGKVAEGVYGKKGVITACKQFPDKKLGNYSPDIYIEFTIKSGAYENTVSVFGHFNKDAMTQKVLNWGLAAKVDQTFARFDAYEGLTDDKRQLEGVMFNEKVLENMIGKPAYMLSYVYGKRTDVDKPAYRNYGYLMPHQDGASEDEHYKFIWDVMQGDNYVMKQIADGQAYLKESAASFAASTSSSSVSSTDNSLDNALKF
jgi:hypothetical protein